MSLTAGRSWSGRLAGGWFFEFVPTLCLGGSAPLYLVVVGVSKNVDGGAGAQSSCAVAPETVSRWERDREQIGPTADRLLRMFVLYTKLSENYPIANFAKISPRRAVPLQFGMTAANNQWRAATLRKRTG